jgi:hypothetical protein
LPLAIALALLGLAQFLDYATFVAMVGRHGIDAELNPLVVFLFERLGLAGVTLAKAASVLLAASTAMLVIRRRRTLGSVVLGFGIGAGLLGALSNLPLT